MPVQPITQEEFEQSVRNSPRPTLVEFWAPWCTHCRRLAPVLEDLARARQQTLTVAKVDIDSQPGLARRYDIQAVPTLVLFQPGRPEARLVGPGSKAQIEAFLTQQTL